MVTFGAKHIKGAKPVVDRRLAKLVVTKYGRTKPGHHTFLAGVLVTVRAPKRLTA